MISNETRKIAFDKFNKLFGTIIAKDIEKSIFDFSVDYVENTVLPKDMVDSIYNGKIDEIYCLLNQNLEGATKAINDKTINPKHIATIKPSELNILLSNKKFLDMMKRKEHNKTLLKKGTSAFKCPKCKKRNCSVMEKQVLSADEPATQFITCLECGHVVMSER